ncbi:MAG: superoxide dismutase, Ni [Candidatus Spechtbacterales bacterium]
MKNLLASILNAGTVYAHCDIPCAIYTVHSAAIAAETVEKMVTKLYEQVPPADGAERKERLEFENTLARCIMVKEEHAELCKREILILWTDYFKPEHLEQFSDLHEKIWKATKLCSQNKREVNAEAAKALRQAVDEINEIFKKAESDQAKAYRQDYL